MTNLSIANSAQELHSVAKTWSAVGNVSSADYGISASGGTNNVAESYQHDAMDRTTAITSTLSGNKANAYNAAGYLTSYEGVSVLSDTTGRPEAVGQRALEYDALGHRTAENGSGLPGTTAGARTLDWSADGRLANVSQEVGASEGTTGYTYAADGLVSSRMEHDSNASDTFIWDSTATNALLLSDGEFEYVYGPNRVPMAQVELATGEVEYLHSDSNGSIIATTNSGGFLVGTTNYGAYGKPLGASLSRFGFAGEWTEPETGYVFLRARWYDPATASFLSKDPLIQQTMEAYGYAGGNPLSRVDPSGLFWGSTPIASWDTIKQGAGKVGKFLGEAASNTGKFIGDTAKTAGRVIGQAIDGAVEWSRSDEATTVGNTLGWVALGLGIASVTVITGGAALPIITGIATVATVGGASIATAKAADQCYSGRGQRSAGWKCAGRVADAVVGSIGLSRGINKLAEVSRVTIGGKSKLMQSEISAQRTWDRAKYIGINSSATAYSAHSSDYWDAALKNYPNLKYGGVEC